MDSRRKLFSLFRPKTHKEETATHNPIFPPFFDPQMAMQVCVDCEEKNCISLCPQAIITWNNTHIELDMSQNGCTFCAECANSCAQEVFSPQHQQRIVAQTTMDIQTCLAWHGCICRTCADACDTHAIRFVGLFYPEIQTDVCTNCGMCITVCPANAITVMGVEI